MSKIKFSEDMALVSTTQAIMCSDWCIYCFPKHNYAEFIYKGNSVCEKHLKKQHRKRK